MMVLVFKIIDDYILLKFTFLLPSELKKQCCPMNFMVHNINPPCVTHLVCPRQGEPIQSSITQPRRHGAYSLVNS
jgi:hypothetical protein